jgi:hypothetical protein
MSMLRDVKRGQMHLRNSDSGTVEAALSAGFDLSVVEVRQPLTAGIYTMRIRPDYVQHGQRHRWTTGSTEVGCSSLLPIRTTARSCPRGAVALDRRHQCWPKTESGPAAGQICLAGKCISVFEIAMNATSTQVHCLPTVVIAEHTAEDLLSSPFQLITFSTDFGHNITDSHTPLMRYRSRHFTSALEIPSCASASAASARAARPSAPLQSTLALLRLCPARYATNEAASNMSIAAYRGLPCFPSATFYFAYRVQN